MANPQKPKGTRGKMFNADKVSFYPWESPPYGGFVEHWKKKGWFRKRWERSYINLFWLRGSRRPATGSSASWTPDTIYDVLSAERSRMYGVGNFTSSMLSLLFLLFLEP